jgi:hypothetical protein
LHEGEEIIKRAIALLNTFIDKGWGRFRKEGLVPLTLYLPSQLKR